MTASVDVVGLGLNAMDTICVVDRFPEPNTKIRIRTVVSNREARLPRL